MQTRKLSTQTKRLGLRGVLSAEPAETAERIMLAGFWAHLHDKGLQQASIASVVSITSRFASTNTSPIQVLPEGGS